MGFVWTNTIWLCCTGFNDLLCITKIPQEANCWIFVLCGWPGTVQGWFRCLYEERWRNLDGRALYSSIPHLKEVNTVLYCIVVYCNTVMHWTVYLYITGMYSTVLHSTVLYCLVKCNTVQLNVVDYRLESRIICHRPAVTDQIPRFKRGLNPSWRDNPDCCTLFHIMQHFAILCNNMQY